VSERIEELRILEVFVCHGEIQHLANEIMELPMLSLFTKTVLDEGFAPEPPGQYQ
jgi:hypothetical protein